MARHSFIALVFIIDTIIARSKAGRNIDLWQTEVSFDMAGNISCGADK